MASSPFSFATLTPDNLPAQKYLAALVDKQPVAAAQAIPAPPPARRAASSRHQQYQLILSFDRPGSGRNGGWRVGKLGPGVDLPVCAPGSRCLKEPILCEISIHPQSGALMLQNWSKDHPIIYLHGNGHLNVELQHLDQHTLHMPVNYLRIGPLHFVLEFSVEDERAYAAHLNDYMLRQYPSWDPAASLDLVPKPTQMRMRDVLVHRQTGSGAFGAVTVGVDRWSGQVVACKTVYCGNLDKVDMMRNELAIHQSIPARAAGLVPLLCSWCEHGQSPPCFSEGDSVHLLMPYAPFTFGSAPWRDMSMATRLALFRQVLDGLRNLHAMGVMHRDISPANLLVFSHRCAPLSAAVSDFGKAKRGTRATETALGPRAFTAPEVRTRAGYTAAIDVFSLGLCFLVTFQEEGWRWRGPMSRTSHATALGRLEHVQGRMPDRLAALLRSMLSWDPAARPTAEEALADAVWEQAAGAPSPSTPEGPASEATTETGSSGSSSSSSSSGGSSGAGPTRQERSGGPPPSSSTGSGSSGNAKRMRGSGSPLPRPGSEVAAAGPASPRPGGRGKRLRRSHSRSLPSPPPV